MLTLLLCLVAGAAPPGELAESHLARLYPESPAVFATRRVLPWAGGTRIRVQQLLDGLPVEGYELVVALDGDGRVQRVGGAPVPRALPRRDATLAASEAVRLATALTGRLGAGSLWEPRVEPVAWVDRSGDAHRAWAVDASTADPPATWRVIVDAYDGRLHHTRPTSYSADGNVYPVSPAISSVTRVELSGLFDGTSLHGDYAEVFTCDTFNIDESLFGVSECSSASQHAVPDASGHFLYDPKPEQLNDPFAEVHLYYHLDHVSAWFDDTFGFAHDAPIRGYVNFPMTNAFFGDFDGDGEGDVSFGQSPDGTDFGYDADVVYHEFGHSVVDGVTTLAFMAADEYGMVWAGGALNEGTADAFAMILTGDPLMAEYAGSHGGGDEPIRDLTAPRRCPDALLGEVHADGELWGSLIWQLMSDPAVGPEVTQELVFGALTTWTLSTNWDDAGLSLLDAATDLQTAQILDNAGHAAVVAHVEAANLIDCERVVALDDGALHGVLMLDAGLSGDFENIPLGVQFSMDVPEDADELRVLITDHGAVDRGMGWRLFVRRGTHVEHEVVELSLLGMQTAVPSVYDHVVDGEGTDVALELTATSELVLDPGETYYFSLAGRNLGDIDPFDFTFAFVEVSAVTSVDVEEERGGCACGGTGQPASGWFSMALVAGIASLRRRRRDP